MYRTACNHYMRRQSYIFLSYHNFFSNCLFVKPIILFVNFYRVFFMLSTLHSIFIYFTQLSQMILNHRVCLPHGISASSVACALLYKAKNLFLSLPLWFNIENYHFLKLSILQVCCFDSLS